MRYLIAAVSVTAFSLAARAGAASVAWVAYPDGGGVVARPFSDGTLGGPVPVCESGASSLPVALTVDPLGEPAAAWIGDGGRVLYSSFDGLVWSPPEEVAPADGVHREVPSLVAGKRRYAVVAWAEAGAGGFEDVFYAVRSEGGWAPPARAHEPDDVPDIMPRVTVCGDSGFSVTWKRLDEDHYVERAIGEAGGSLSEEPPPDGVLEAVRREAVPLQAAIAWSGSDGYAGTAYYKELEDEQLALDALEGQKRESQESETRLQNIILCFGDSITYGRGSSTNGPKTGYPIWLQSILDYNYPGYGFQVVNKGIPMETTSSGLDRIDDEIRRYNPGYVLIMEGTNDIYYGVSLETIQENLKQMALKAVKMGVVPILATIIPTHPSLRSIEYQRTKSFYTGRYVQKLKDRYGIPYADQWNAFVTVPDFASVLLYPNPGNHPNDNGYRYAMAPEWYESLAPYLEIPFTPSEVWLGLSESAASVTRGSSVSFSYAVAPSNDVVRNAVDCYVAVRDPLGRFYFVGKGGALSGRTTSIASKVLLQSVPASGSLFTFSVSSDAPTGNYTLYAVTARSLRDVWNSEYWTSNLAEIGFTVL